MVKVVVTLSQCKLIAALSNMAPVAVQCGHIYEILNQFNCSAGHVLFLTINTHTERSWSPAILP